MEEGLKFSPLFPENPDMVGAIGAALYGEFGLEKQKEGQVPK
jgi:activator of 2-hydroxyglutaryl-CoA dehydratase